jgi:tetratricopeptide (TPR) repeat protein
MSIRLRSVVILALLSALSRSPAATAAFTVFGNGQAQLCAGAARAEEKGTPPSTQAMEACDRAISSENLEIRDLAGSYINRGILYIVRAKYKESKRDFDSAINLMPDLGEAYINRGAALVALKRYKEAIADLDRSLTMNPTEPEKAYFNRGLAEEGLDDIQSAYRDYSHAAELKPDWILPRNELSRFTVATPAS